MASWVCLPASLLDLWALRSADDLLKVLFVFVFVHLRCHMTHDEGCRSYFLSASLAVFMSLHRSRTRTGPDLVRLILLFYVVAAGTMDDCDY